MPPPLLRLSQRQFGWTRFGLICDKLDSYSTSFFDLMNGTDPTNINNLQPPIAGPYDMPRLEIAHAERIDLDNDNNATKDALIAAIKAKDVKVIMLFGQTAFVDGILTYGLDKGIFSPGLGYQFLVIDPPYPEKMDSRSLAAMDGMLTTTATGVAPEYNGFKRSSAFWIRHPPTQPVGGAGVIRGSTPFQVSGRKPRFFDAAMYDSIMLAATAIDACLKDGCRPTGRGYDEVMPYFRAASIDGISGPTSIKVGSNDPQGRLFSVRVGKNPASRGLNGSYVFNEVAVTTTHAPDLQVCTGSKIGESCFDHAAAPGLVKCFASSATTIDVEWVAAEPQGDGLLTGYRVTAFYRERSLVAVVNSTAETQVTFTRVAANTNQRLEHSVRYSVQVEALYSTAAITSKPAMCIVPQDGLPCIPPLSAASTTNIGEQVEAAHRILVTSFLKRGASDCPCMTSTQVYEELNRGTCVCVCVCSIMYGGTVLLFLSSIHCIVVRSKQDDYHW